MAQYDINLREYWRILRKRKAIVVITAIILGFFSTSFSILRAPTPVYTSVCSIKFEKETAVEGLYAKTLSWSGSDDMETQISIINSFSIFEKVAQKIGLIPNRAIKEGHLKSNIIRVVIGLQSKVEVTREKFTNILNIKVEDESPSFAQKLANTIALTYKEIHSERQMKRTLEALKYIKEQLEAVQRKLREAEEAFNKFSQDNQLIAIDLQSGNLLMRSQDTQADLRKIQKYIMELESISGRVDRFIKDPSGSDNDFYSEKISGRYQTASANLMELMLKRDTLLEDYTPQHPEVISIGRNIIENARKMLILLRVEIRDSEIKEIDLLNELRSIRKKTDLMMERKIEFDRRKRRVDYYRNMTALLEEKNQEALIRKAEKPEEITMVRPALLPTVPVNPPKTATTGAIGLLIGLILGLVAALVVETFDTSLGAIEDVEETIGAPVLGVIPHVDTKQIQQSLREKFPDGVEDLPSIIQSPHIISHFAPMSIIAESFRALRTGIQFKEADQPIKSIAITSASPQEGKTFVSINFSITMAQAGMKVLLVGADMRKPMLSKALGLESTPGLSDILLGSYSWRDSLKTITDVIMGKIGLDGAMITPGLDNLHIISSGAIPPNPAELIESKGIGDFVKEAESAYDIIIFDAPPILSTADAAIIANKMDGVLLVYRVGTVSRGLLKRSAIQLEQAKSQILGVILNGMRPEISPDFHDFKYYKYDYAYTSRAEDKKRRKSFWGRGDSSGKREKPSEKDVIKGAILGQEKQGPGKWKIPAGIAALALLVSVILWQKGIIDPFNRPGLESHIQEESIEQVTKKKPGGGVNRKGLINGSGPVSSSMLLFAEDQDSSQGALTASASKEIYTKTLSRTTEENKTVREKPESSSLKSIAARFWERTVRDITASISAGKSASPSKSRVVESENHTPKKQVTTSYRKSLGQAGEASNKEAKTPVPQTKPGSKSGVKVTGNHKVTQSQSKTLFSEKMALRPKKEQAKESKTSIIQAGAISMSTVEVLVEREDVQSQLKRFSPKMIRAKTQKKRSKESLKFIPRADVRSKSYNTDEKAKEDLQAPHEASSMKIIVSKTQAGQEGIAQIPLHGSLQGVPGKKDVNKTGSSDQGPSYPYSLYLGSFRTAERAEKAIVFYRKNGVSPYRAKVEFREKGVWFRVYGGYFKDVEQAERFKEEHKLSEAKARKTNYANLVGTYSNKKELKDKLSSLENMGYYPYVIKGGNGSSGLFLGAYVTEKGAEQQYHDLKSKGISVEVIRR